MPGSTRRSARSPRCSSAAGTWRSRTRCPPSWSTGSASPSARVPTAAYRDLLDTDRWQRLANAGARPQRLLFASTGTKDPKASDMPLRDWLRGPQHGQHDARGDPAGLRRPRRAGRRSLPTDGGDAAATLASPSRPPAWTWPHSGSSCRTMAPRPSCDPGTSSSSASAARAVSSRRQDEWRYAPAITATASGLAGPGAASTRHRQASPARAVRR